MTLIDAQFSPHWILTAVVGLLVAVFVYLGLWQLERAEQKQQLAETLTLRQQQKPLALIDDMLLEESNLQEPSDPENFAQKLEYRQLKVEGEFLPEKSVLIENRKHRGKTGFHVITPFLLSKGEHILLINRGWVKAGPELSIPQFDTPSGTLQLIGTVSIPSPPVLDLTDSDQSGTAVTGSIQRWPFFTLERYQQWSGGDIYPLVLLLSPESQGGFTRQWPKPQVDPSMHIGYALQWFAFALIVILIWLKLSMKKRSVPAIQSDGAFKEVMEDMEDKY
ncbi:SURF1 family protein [Motiliproteus sp. MSK22-1]|uniref:SURF1 family protein n=1 Tax=Motiliproteus sp. MSK22-1 TaxID=1897630 RepID=UPI0009779A6E|nr:SURF1 family protein [Motiliproteus sp. MSK22-1]OMH30286.1 hypothetical protein BGP75_18010 [Motiliproteus sp. MSK22-1]